MDNTITKDLTYYMALPYTIELKPDAESGSWFAKIQELPGCMTYADSRNEVLDMIEDAKRTWIEWNLSQNRPIPEPAS